MARNRRAQIGERVMQLRQRLFAVFAVTRAQARFELRASVGSACLASSTCSTAR